ncbi:MAG: ADP-ribose pyrophosphatase [Syntrophorhabdaceae bacterium PtaU1.Bin034]|jgi:8-oxo-dGTP pyrophosphatase MutT (NUDIX family)|nr:MAG: ADP-ribose pyrophosphatase [Syntrophorhabdaceae bacterium PtaU1.Bin034]
MIKEWDILSSRLDKDYRIFKISVDQAVSPRTHHTNEFYRLESGNWVNVICLTPSNDVVMIRQYRHGSRRVTLEIPGGLIDETDPCQAAVRELAEETGYEGDPVSLLGSVNPNPAIFNNLCYTYLVENAQKTRAVSLDLNEDIEVELIPLTRIPSIIVSGQIDHALVIVAFYLYFQKSGFPGQL